MKKNINNRSLLTDINRIVDESWNKIMNFEDLDKKFIQLAEDYKVSLYEVMRLRYNREHDILQYIENVTKK